MNTPPGWYAPSPQPGGLPFPGAPSSPYSPGWAPPAPPPAPPMAPPVGPPPPPPPPGLGAHPGFAPPAPPRNRTRLVVSLVVAATLLLCCGGGVTGVVGFGYYAYSAVQADAIDTVGLHLETLKGGRFTVAYEQLCPKLQLQESSQRYVRRQESAPQIRGYRVAEETSAGPQGGLVVLADVTRGDRPPLRESYEVVYDEESQAKICS